MLQLANQENKDEVVEGREYTLQLNKMVQVHLRSYRLTEI